MLPALLLLLLVMLLTLALGSCTTGTTGTEEGTDTGTGSSDATYTVRLLNPDGSEVYKTEGTSGTAVVYLPERTGYKFDGYFSDAALTAPAQFSGLIGNADQDLYIKWAPIQYTIRFDGGRGVGEMDELTVTYDEKVTLPANTFVLRGETFEEWQMVGENGSVYSYVDGGRVSNLTAEDGATVVLTAVFDNYDSANFTVENGVVLAYNGSSTSVRLPQTATKVSADVFKNCAVAGQITKLEIPSCYTEIEQGALAPLTALAEVRLPFIGGSADENNFFAYLFGADHYEDNHFSFEAEIYLNSLVESNADYSSLLVPTTLKKVVVTNPLNVIAEGAFYHVYSLEKVVLLNCDDLYEIGASAFEGCINLGYDSEMGIANPLNFLGGVETIGDRAFSAYISEPNSEGSSYIFTRLFQISPLDSIQTIGSQAFYGCVYLLELQFGDALESIGEEAFLNCVSLTKLNLPDSLTTIGDYAFMSCSGMTELTLGSGVSSIGSFAFADCTGLAQVTVRGSLPARIAQIPFSNGLEPNYDVNGSITGYNPLFTDLTLFVGEEVLETYRSQWVSYADLLDTKKQSTVYYWGANADGSFATRFELQGGNIAYVTDTDLEFLNMIDMFSDLYNTFRADIENNRYTMTFEEVEIPEELKRGDERFFRISNPQIVDALNEPTDFLVRIRPERYEKDGSVYYVPTLEWVDSFFGTVGDPDSSLYMIQRDEWGHYIFYTRPDLNSEFVETMPEGAVYGEYQIHYILAYVEKMVSMSWYDEKGNLLSTDKYLLCGDDLYPSQGEDALEVCFTDYPFQILLDGKGNALMSLYENGSFNDYIGKYTVGAGQTYGDDTLTITLSGLNGHAGLYNGSMTLSGFFGGIYHKCQLSASSASNFVNQTLYSSADLEGSRVSYSEDESAYYVFYDYKAASGTGEAHFVEYFDGTVSSHGSYVREEDVLTISIPGYRDVTGYVDDPRGSFHVNSAFGTQTFRVYDDWENATFYMEEDFMGVVLTYYIVRMDGYGNALFYDGHDDGYDNWYIGTYYNTHESIGEDENGLIEIYYFEGVECDENGNIIKNGKTFRTYYVPDTIVYEDEDEEGNFFYSGALLSVSSSTESQQLTAYDERGLKFADLTVSPFGVVTMTIYDTVFENGELVSTVNQELTDSVVTVAYQNANGELVYVVAFDAAGNYLFRLSQNAAGDWVYEYEGELHPQPAPEPDVIVPDVSTLTPAD